LRLLRVRVRKRAMVMSSEHSYQDATAEEEGELDDEEIEYDMDGQ